MPEQNPGAPAPNNEQQLNQLADLLSKMKPLFEGQPGTAGSDTNPAPPAQPVQQPPAQQPLSVTLPNGQVISAASPEELSRQLEFILAQADRERQLATAREQEAQTPKTGPSWKNPSLQQKEQFARTFLDNPYEAVNLALREITGFDNPVETLQGIARETAANREAVAIQQFLVGTPDYLPSGGNQLALHTIMQRNGWTVTPESLTAAWGLAKQYNIAQVRATEQPGQQPQQPQQQHFTPQPGPGAQLPFQHALVPGNPPPAVPRGNGLGEQEAALLDSFGDLSVEQMRELLMKAGSQK